MESKGGFGRLFARAQQRRRERREREEHERAERARMRGEDRARRALDARRAMEEERARFQRARSGREGGGYGVSAGPGARVPRAGPYPLRAPAEGAGAPPLGGETWRGGEFRGGRERWRGAEFRGGGAETWRSRRPSAAMLPTERQPAHPRGLGAGGDEGRWMERGHAGPRWYGWRPSQLDHPSGLGAFWDRDDARTMERGWHPERPGEGSVEPIRSGGWGGPHPAWAASAPGARSRQRGGGEEWGWGQPPGYRGPPGGYRGQPGGYEGRPVEREWPAPGTPWEPPGARRRRDESARPWSAPPVDLEARALEAERMGPGAFRRPHRAERWEGPSEAARTGAGFGGGSEGAGWSGGGPGVEHPGDGFRAVERPGPAGPEWYGGGVHEATEDRPGGDFGSLGGPAHGRFGREPPPDRGGGRGFGGPLGRWQDRSRGEQGRLYDGRYRGREAEYPISGEAHSGRGHVGGRAYRDLERWGWGSPVRRGEERDAERHDEGGHYREP